MIEDIIWISKVLGHKNPRVTLEKYIPSIGNKCIIFEKLNWFYNIIKRTTLSQLIVFKFGKTYNVGLNTTWCEWEIKNLYIPIQAPYIGIFF